MYLLALDTATDICGVALIGDGRSLARTTLALGRTHSREVMAAVDWVLQRMGITAAQIDAFGVTQGPGSFTGLRIGISTAKGLAAAWDKPLLGVCSLEVLAHQSPSSGELICPILDARRGEVYWALYERRGQDLALRVPPRVGPALEISAHIQAACLLIGNGVGLYGRILDQHCRVPLYRVADELNDICPAVLGRLAFRQWQSGVYPKGLDLSPAYIRPSDAIASSLSVDFLEDNG